MSTVTSASRIFLSSTSAQIVKEWPAFTSSVAELLLKRNCVLPSTELPSHRTLAWIAKVCLFFLLFLETVCLEHSPYSYPNYHYHPLYLF